MAKRAVVPVRPGPLPETADELAKQNPQSILERVKYAIQNGAYADLRALMNATTDANAVEGKIVWDRGEAARKLRAYFKETGDLAVGELNIDQMDRMIVKAMKQLKIGRTQRRKADQLVLQLHDDEPPVTDNG